MGNVISGNLVAQPGRQMKQNTQFIDGGNIDNPVADVDDIADMAGNQPGFSYGDGIADGKIGLLGLGGVGDKLVLAEAKLFKLLDGA